MDWRNSVLILCFAIFTPYAWEYLVGFFASVVPANQLSIVLLGNTAEHVNVRLMTNSIIYSFFACFIIAIPCGMLMSRMYTRNAFAYALFSSIHLVIVFVFERISAAAFYWPLAGVETITFFIWIFLATMTGVFMRRFYFHLVPA